MNYYPQNLHTLIHGYTVDLESKKQIAKDIISGIMYLHSVPLIHRDIKPGNILLTSVNEIRAAISDFGYSKFIENGVHSFEDNLGKKIINVI